MRVVYIFDVGCEQLDFGSAYEEMQRYEDALSAHQASRNLTPDCLLWYYKVAETLNKFNRYDDALQKIETAVSMNPNKFYLYDYLAATLHSLNRKEHARFVDKKALMLFTSRQND